MPLVATVLNSTEGLIAVYAVLISAVAFLVFGWDKLCAVEGRWRVPESSLLFWGFVGGAAGGKLGQRVFRHKTRKEPFRTHLNGLFVWNIFLYPALIFEPTRFFIASSISTMLEALAG